MSDFKVGDDVVCVDSDGNGWITEGNTYPVINMALASICIVNEENSTFWYPKKLFVKAEQVNKDNWKPKVGEPCVCTSLIPHEEVTPDFVGKEIVVFTRLGNEIPCSITAFKPIKTQAEIEQDRIIDKALHTLGHSRGDDAIVGILKQLYHANLLSDKQVKPLSNDLIKVLNFLLGIRSMNGYDFGEVPEGKKSFWWREHLREAMKPYTIQGGEQ